MNAVTPYVTREPFMTVDEVPPGSPIEGDLWWSTIKGALYVWYDDGNTGQWVLAIDQDGSDGGVPSPANIAFIHVGSVAPAPATDKHLWWNTELGELFIRYNDGTSSQWVPTTPAGSSGGGSSVSVSINPPGSPTAGQMWWHSTLGKLFIWYVDGDSSQWVPATPTASSDVISIKRFGAVGDGVTDDTAALQAGVDYVGTRQLLLHAPAGKYKITDEITFANCTTRFGIVGDGPRLTRFLLTSFGQTKKFLKGINPGTNTRTLENLLFSDFEICAWNGDGGVGGVPVSQKTDPIAIYLPYESGSVLRNIRVRAIGNTAYWISCANNTRLENCWAFGAGGWHVTNKTLASSDRFSITALDATLTATVGTPFAAGDVGKTIYLGDAGIEGDPFATTIASYTSPTSVEVTTAPPGGMTSGRVSFDGVKGSISALSTTLTLDTDCIEAADVGRFIYVVGADANGGVLVTTIASRTSGTVVELALAAVTTATTKDVYFTPAYFIGCMTTDIGGRNTNDIHIEAPLVEAWKGCDYLFKEGVSYFASKLKTEGWSGSSANNFGINARNMVVDSVRHINIDGMYVVFGYSYSSGNILVCGGFSSIHISGMHGAGLPVGQYYVDFRSNDIDTTLTIDGGSLDKPDTSVYEPGLVRYGGLGTSSQVYQGATLLTRRIGDNARYGQRLLAGRVESSTFVKTGTATVALLPTAATAGAGARHFVTDANATTFMSVVAGGGANKVPVVSDGAAWRIG